MVDGLLKLRSSQPYVNAIGKRLEGRDNNLNLIRMVAALCVLISHSFPLAYGPFVDEPLESQFGKSLGWFAVIVFFYISGLLVTRSLLRQSSVLEWAIARAARIFPGLFVVLVLSAFILGPLVTQLPLIEYYNSSLPYIYVPRNMLLVSLQYDLPGVFEQNAYGAAVNGSLWTLFYEAACYALLVALFLTGFLKSGRRLLVALLVLLVGNLSMDMMQGSCSGLCSRIDSFLGFSFPFVLGCLTWLYRDRERINPATVLLMFMLAFVFRSSALSYAFIVPAICVTVLYFGYGFGGIVHKYNQLGDYSYGVYIYAFPVQQAMAYFYSGSDWWVNVLLSLPVTLMFAVMSWHYVESPAMQFAKNKAWSPTALRRLSAKGR